MANQELDPIVQAFIYETEGMLEQMEQILLSCEETGEFTDDDVNEIFRIMHTIKGGAGMMLFNKLAELAHHLEDMFYFIREEEPDIEDISLVSDVVLEGIDFMKEYIEGMKVDDYEDLEADDIVAKIQKNISIIKEGATDIEEEEVEEETVKVRTNDEGTPLTEINNIELDMDSDIETECYHLVLRYTEGCEMENLRAFQAAGEIKASAVNMKYFPGDLMEGDSAALSEVIRMKGFQVNLQTEWSYKELEEMIESLAFVDKFTIEKIDLNDMGVFDDSDEEEVVDTTAVNENKKDEQVQEQGAKDKKVAKTKKKAAKNDKKEELDAPHVQEQKRINVPVEKLDMLMDLVGELVLSETMVISNPDLKGLKLDNFSKAARQHRKIIGEVQDIVMSVRMMPLSTTFTKMKRIVRDISKKLDRDMQIELIGEETEVDKNIIEQIGDPLMHLVRNAADHGIESAEERAELGKMDPPLITLEAQNAGGDVIIKVMDNGKGLDRDKILQKAIKNKLVEADAELTDKQVYQMIFMPGLSTSEEITEFSGRGVGMDVVRNNIEGLGGTISVDSVKDQGTTVTLKIPLTLAIVSGMIIRVGNAKYTVPIMSIQESFRPSAKDIIVDTDGNEMVMVRGNCYIIRRLNRMYGVSNAVENFEDGILIMIENNDDTYCIFADEIIGEQQVVVKPLPEYVKRFNTVHGIAGCTLLGDGDISLILDIGSINN